MDSLLFTLDDTDHDLLRCVDVGGLESELMDILTGAEDPDEDAGSDRSALEHTIDLACLISVDGGHLDSEIRCLVKADEEMQKQHQQSPYTSVIDDLLMLAHHSVIEEDGKDDGEEDLGAAGHDHDLYGALRSPRSRNKSGVCHQEQTDNMDMVPSSSRQDQDPTQEEGTVTSLTTNARARQSQPRQPTAVVGAADNSNTTFSSFLMSSGKSLILSRRNVNDMCLDAGGRRCMFTGIIDSWNTQPLEGCLFSCDTMEKYQGYFENGKPHGPQGTWETMNGFFEETYKGSFAHGEFLKGTYQTPYFTFAGTFRSRKNFQHGVITYKGELGSTGTCTSDTTGTGTGINTIRGAHIHSYRGDFNFLNQFHGTGKLTTVSASVSTSSSGGRVHYYIGDFKKGRMHGLGTLLSHVAKAKTDDCASQQPYVTVTDTDACVFDENENTFVPGQLMYTYAGRWKRNLQWGAGQEDIVMTGEGFSGTFHRGQRHGRGTLKLSVVGTAPGLGGNVNVSVNMYEGMWRNGCPVDDYDCTQDQGPPVAAAGISRIRRSCTSKESVSTSTGGGDSKIGMFSSSSYFKNEQGSSADKNSSGWRISFADGSVYEGDVVMLRPHGDGSLRYGDCYRQYHHQTQGRGVLMYKGGFKAGLRQGHGTCAYMNGRIEKGVWQGDELVSSARHIADKTSFGVPVSSSSFISADVSATPASEREHVSNMAFQSSSSLLSSTSSTAISATSTISTCTNTDQDCASWLSDENMFVFQPEPSSGSMSSCSFGEDADTKGSPSEHHDRHSHGHFIAPASRVNKPFHGKGGKKERKKVASRNYDLHVAGDHQNQGEGAGFGFAKLKQERVIKVSPGRVLAGLLDFNLTGTGTMIMIDGARYVGELKRGLMHGKGRLVDVRGVAYDGLWKEGDFVKGREEMYENENHDFLQEEIEGFCDAGNTGSMPLCDGADGDSTVRSTSTLTIYEGSFRASRRHGRGSLRVGVKLCEDDSALDTSSGRLVYEGEWCNGIFHGFGAYHYHYDDSIMSLASSRSLPVKYEGTIDMGRRCRGGRLTLQDGHVFKGQWYDERMLDGEWSLTFPDGSSYDGQASIPRLTEQEEGKQHECADNGAGQHYGVMVFSDVPVPSAIPVPNGLGTMRQSTGDVYVGNFKDGKFQSFAHPIHNIIE
jgi:hypothetical protein